MTTIYKICTVAEWRAAEREGVYRGSAVDRRDGFIHFSTAEQAAETAAKHFAGQRDLVLVAVDGDALGAALKWEPSRGGALFPHLYGALDPKAVRRVDALPLDAAGRHVFPKIPRSSSWKPDSESSRQTQGVSRLARHEGKDQGGRVGSRGKANLL
jgi:uncharacterized protein (DUF952 family)